ncbi:tumor-related protein-like (ISS) [Planoprotostelium fungivorum]|uniref:Calmodulin-lysine N-methyltransferase n=1 Tax=Planoprotostelium fungivorum TaxID=1890364 RepID=A0A2P6NSW0_9EUKA|nr:tumor-related protein-like (ISS) [Planoprotostelium fungivorum]
MDVYLKYFHGGNQNIDELLDKADRLEEERNLGQLNQDEVNNLHIDEKEDGGVGSVVTVGFTKSSYKAAAKKKSKGRLYDLSVAIHQSGYSSTGNAWKVWDSSIVLARWCYDNADKLKDKTSHEIGSGCGLVAIIASMFCAHTTILANIQKNVESNEQTARNVTVTKLDFQELYEGRHTTSDKDRVDVLLGSDVLYGLHLSQWLPAVVDAHLKPDGVFYLVNPKNRIGLDEFVKNMEALGIHCHSRTIDEKYCEDIVKKPCWDLVTCSRDQEKLKVTEKGEKEEDRDEFVDLETSFFSRKELKKWKDST